MKNGISTNGAINSAFMGFLTEAVTKVAGGSVDSKLESWKTKLDNKVGEAVDAAKNAKTNATAAQGSVDTKLRREYEGFVTRSKKP